MPQDVHAEQIVLTSRLSPVAELLGRCPSCGGFRREFLAHVAARIVNEVKGGNRVLYTVMSKPLGTIEWKYGGRPGSSVVAFRRG